MRMALIIVVRHPGWRRASWVSSRMENEGVNQNGGGGDYEQNAAHDPVRFAPCLHPLGRYGMDQFQNDRPAGEKIRTDEKRRQQVGAQRQGEAGPKGRLFDQEMDGENDHDGDHHGCVDQCGAFRVFHRRDPQKRASSPPLSRAVLGDIWIVSGRCHQLIMLLVRNVSFAHFGLLIVGLKYRIACFIKSNVNKIIIVQAKNGHGVFPNPDSAITVTGEMSTLIVRVDH